MKRFLGICAAFVVAAGCTKASRSPLFGRVTVGGQLVNAGEIRFVPTDDDGRGPAKFVTEVMIQPDGSYKCATLGGLPPGRYRVEVDARKKTGKKVTRKDAGTGEMLEFEEAAPAGAKAYAGKDSPLTVDTAITAGQFDIDIPAS